MRFLLVAPRFVERAGEYYIFPLGLAYISASLKRAGHEVHCLNLNHVDEPKRAITDAIARVAPEAVGTGALSVHFRALKQITATVRSVAPDLPIIVGGGAVSASPHTILRLTDATVGVIGEGEEVILELAAALTNGAPLGDISGIVYRDGDTIRQTGARKAIATLASLPIPDYDGFGFEQHLRTQLTTDHHFLNFHDTPRVVSISASRSCPYSCTFCFHPIGKVYRERSLDEVFAEIDMLVAKYGANQLAVLDELFAVKKPRLIEFCQRIKDYGLKWTVQLRVDVVDEETMELMKQAGCAYVSFGLESMNQTVLTSMKKKCRPQETVDALTRAYQARVGIQGNFIFGDPAETMETAVETISWWSQNRHLQVFLAPVQCYPGTAIFQTALKSGVVADEERFLQDGCPIVNVTGMDAATFERLRRRIHVFNQTCLYPGQLIDVDGPEEVHPVRGPLFTVTARCPHCHEQVRYGRVPGDAHTFGLPVLRLHCRNCHQRLDIAMPRRQPARETQEIYAACLKAAQAGLVDACLKGLNAVMRADPTYDPAWTLAGRILLSQGQADAALSHLERAVLLAPLDAQRHLDMASCLEASGEHYAAEIHRGQARFLLSRP